MKLKLIALCAFVGSGCASVEKKENFFAWPDNYKFLPLGEELAVKPKPVELSNTKQGLELDANSSTKNDELFSFDSDYLDLKRKVKPKELVKVENPQPKPLPVVAVNEVAPVNGDDGLGVFFIQIGAYTNKSDAKRASMAHSDAKVFEEGRYFKVGIFGFDTFFTAKRDSKHYLNAWIRRTEQVKSALVVNNSSHYQVKRKRKQSVSEVKRPLRVAVAEEPKVTTPVVAEEPKVTTPVVAEEPVKKYSPVALVPQESIKTPKKKLAPKSVMLSEFLSTGLKEYPKVVWRVNKKNGSGLDYKISLTDIWLNSNDRDLLKLVKSNFPVSLCQLADRTLVVIHSSANCSNWNNL